MKCIADIKATIQDALALIAEVKKDGKIDYPHLIQEAIKLAGEIKATILDCGL